MKLAEKRDLRFPHWLRRGLLSWLIGAAVEYALFPQALRDLGSLDSLGAMSIPRMVFVALASYCGLSLVSRLFPSKSAERWGLPLATAVLSALALRACFSWPFLCVLLLLLSGMLLYALLGWNSRPRTGKPSLESSRGAVAVTACLALLFFAFVSLWTVCRVATFSAPTFDFGIFSQMFHQMRTTGLPNTTLERDGLLSHFQVHVSPIYYLMLPLYCLFPTPAVLQILQAAVLASAVIPLWKLARLQGFHPWGRALLCGLLLFYPAYSGGASYDLHENAFLTPLLLWLFLGIDGGNLLLVVISGSLTLLVKEDAAVYVALVGLWLGLRGLLHKNRWEIAVGGGVFACALVWFLLVTGYLSKYGDGVMTYRYSNFMFEGSGSLLTVVKAVILSPMKALYECVDKEKLEFIALTMGPLLGLPLLTRRFERLVLLIPYVLVNLMSDYRYQHDIFFQYTYGSTACLFYLVTVNLSDFMAVQPALLRRYAPMILALLTSAALFGLWVAPTGLFYPRCLLRDSSHYQTVSQALSQIPQDASVAATTFYTVPLSQRDVLYDVQYSSTAHMLSTEYVVLEVNGESCYKAYATNGEHGFENLTALLERNGYTRVFTLEDTLVIYRRK